MPGARAGLAALVLIAACGGGHDDIELTGATPAHGPLVGGTRITLHGDGFARIPAASPRVQIAGREAPLVTVTSDTTLDVVTPPGDRPGDAEVVVLAADRSAIAHDIFHYSGPPTLTAVSPADVFYDLSTTPVTLTGTGFLAEDAGEVTVLVNGQLGSDVEVLDDTTLRFVAPSGAPMTEPAIEVRNRRGRATRPHGFRYVPSLRPGLLLFSSGGGFAMFLDPVELTEVFIALNDFDGFDSVVVDERGDYWATVRNTWGRIDFNIGFFEPLRSISRSLPAMARVGRDYFAIDRFQSQFGRFDPRTGELTPLGNAELGCCDAYALAARDGLYIISGEAQGTGQVISTIDPRSGMRGSLQRLDPLIAGNVLDMRFLGDTLYVATDLGGVATVDPATGTVRFLPTDEGPFSAMELFVPRPPGAPAARVLAPSVGVERIP